jgi:transglutaminase-like putative cysteine protease
MLIRIGFDLIFEFPAPTPMLLMLYVHPSREKDLVEPEVLKLSPAVPIELFTDSWGNKAGRIIAPAGQLRITNNAVVRDTGEPDVPGQGMTQLRVDQLLTHLLPLLLPSRYCEVDQLTTFAWEKFGHIPLGWPRVQAVLDWVHNHITFGYQFARPTKSAYDVFYERKGVCRDFMHLSVALLRALNIPARYVTGYLGDIGVPVVPEPMDFSAWFEVYLGGQWWTCDARHNKPRIGRVLMATGRDASDVALTTSFGPHILRQFQVVTDEIK